MYVEKGIATHSSILAWRIPWTEEPDGLQSIGLHGVRHNGATNTHTYRCMWSFPGGSVEKNPACNAGDLGSVPGSGRSPGAGYGNPLQYSCLENSMDRGAWRGTVHGVAKSWIQLRDWHLVPSLHGKQMGKQWKQCQTLFFGALESLQMVIAAMKLKDAYSLEEKLWPT